MTPPSSAPTEARIDLFHAGGREAEIEEVFRRILATGAPLDQVEIACTSDAHIGLIWEKALRHNWPVTLGAGIPATFTRPGRALIGLCDWIETDFCGRPFPPSAAVRRHQRRGAGRIHRRPGCARARAGGGRLGPRHVRLVVHAPGQELRGASGRSRMRPTTIVHTRQNVRSRRRTFVPG